LFMGEPIKRTVIGRLLLGRLVAPDYRVPSAHPDDHLHAAAAIRRVFSVAQA